MVEIDHGAFLIVVAVAALAALLASTLGARVGVPVVVIEVVAGIVIGPDVLGWVQTDDFVEFFAALGLGMLFFFAGYEIDFERIRGAPLKLALAGWVLSLALAFSLGGALAAAGVVLSLVYTGAAMSTTALGTLIPILGDAGVLRTRTGTFLLGAGAIGEFGPILLITIAFSSGNSLSSLLILLAFVLVAVVVALLATRSVGRGLPILKRTLESSSQLAVRLTVLLVFAMAALADELGLDLLLGGFVAGMVVRLALRDREIPAFESKITAVGYGFLIPMFFIVSGVRVDVSSLTADSAQMLKVPLFLVLFLIVRGVPALVLYKRVLALRERIALGLFSATQLPLVVAITTIAVDKGEMHTSTAAALVAAAILSTALYPLIGLRLRSGDSETAAAPPTTRRAAAVS